MKLEPRNKRLVLELVKSEQQESVMSEFAGLSKKRPDNFLYKVIERSDDCTISVHTGNLVVIEGNMVEESKVGEVTFLTCKENFVVGLIKD
jgi:hypothetical protein